MKFLLIDKHGESSKTIDGSLIANNLSEADIYDFGQFSFHSLEVQYQTIYISEQWDIYCFDVALIPKRHHPYFLIWKVQDEDFIYKITYFFDNLAGIFLHTLSLVSRLVTVNIPKIDKSASVSIKNLLLNEWRFAVEATLVNSEVLVPDNGIVTESLYDLYGVLDKSLSIFSRKWYIWNIFFEDFILSLLPEKYWCKSLFFLSSKLKFKISNFFNVYNDIISLHIPVARSKYLEDLFESLLLQTDKRYKIYMGVDGYTKKQKDDIVAIIKKYKDRFDNFEYFVNRKNFWVWKTRWKLLNGDPSSRYIVFLDDDNFLSTNTIGDLYKKIGSFPRCGMYSIANIDVRFDIDYRNYIGSKWPFSQPAVYTNREHINRLPLYCDQEETPLIHDRFYSDLLDIRYDSTFDSCSVDMVFNRFLEIICWNMNFDGIYQFMRVWHQYHQTRSAGFDEKEFRYVMYILKTISYLNNNNYYYTYVIKTQVPKQNELFTKAINNV